MADKADIKELFKAGAHFGHQKSKTDARSGEYIYTFKNKIAVIDLSKTQTLINDALNFISKEAQNGALFLFVGTKLQAQEAVKKNAVELEMPYIIERWPGGLLTNFDVVSKSIKRLVKTEKELAEGKYDHLTKAERVKMEKDLKKSELVFGGLRTLDRMPSAVIVVDASKEMIAIKEAKVKGIPVIALCDTNSNPREIDLPIVSNDDSKSTIELILGMIAKTVKENYKPRVKEETEERVEKAIEKGKKFTDKKNDKK